MKQFYPSQKLALLEGVTLYSWCLPTPDGMVPHTPRAQRVLVVLGALVILVELVEPVELMELVTIYTYKNISIYIYASICIRGLEKVQDIIPNGGIMVNYHGTK